MTTDTQKGYIQEAEKKMKKYQDVLAGISKFLESRYEKKNKDIQAYEKTLTKQFTDAEKQLTKIKDAGEDEVEKVNEALGQVFDEIKSSLYDFSKYISVDQLYKGKDELINFGNEKLEEAQQLLKNHPFMAAGSALSIGFIIGKLFGRSK